MTKAYRIAITKALLIGALISCIFAIGCIPIEHFLAEGWQTIAAIWVFKLITGSASVLMGAEACKECLARKHDSNHPDCDDHWSFH